jgi:cytoskeletal protein RodZ
MNSKITIALLFVMFSLGGMIAIPGLSLIPTTTAYAQIPTTPEELFPDFFDDGEDENANGDDGAAEAEDDDNGDDSGDTQGDDNQNLEQTNEQEQEAEQEVEQTNDQSETNAQSNELNTGDNTATVTQANAADQAVEAAAAESGDAEAEAEEGSTSSDADSIADADATATGLIDQDNNADVNQDSSANDNILVNENTFGDDTNIQVAVPIVDRAVNLNLNIIEEEVPPDEEPPDEEGVFCLVERLVPGGEEQRTICFATEAECESAEAVAVQFGVLVEECQEFEEPPAGALICRFDPQAGSVCE